MSNHQMILLEDGWCELRKAIEELEEMLNGGRFKSGFVKNEYIKVYTKCFVMCTQPVPYNWSTELYQRYSETIGNILTNQVSLSVKDKTSLGGTSLLVELQSQWCKHQIRNKWLKYFFNYLDRYHVTANSLPHLSDVGLTSFKEKIYNEIKSEAAQAFLQLITFERDGEMIDKYLLKDCVLMFESMGMGSRCEYIAELETPLVFSTRQYYSKKRQEWILTDSTPGYMLKAEVALKAERNRVNKYLNQSSEKKLLRVVEEEILEAAILALIESEGSGCHFLLENDKTEDLQRMFRLFSPLESGLKPISASFESFILLTSRNMTQQKANLDGGGKEKLDDTQYVKSLLHLQDKCHNMVTKVFSGHLLFQKAFGNAFTKIMNEDVGIQSNAELLSLYCDQILRCGGEKLSHAEVEEKIDRVVQLFIFLRDKDLFADIYRHHMAKRLLSQRAASVDAEKLMIAKLKLQCGTNFTTKLEGMLTDLATGTLKRNEFEMKLRDKNLKIEFNVQVLTMGYWPTYTILNVPLTPDMTTCMDTFHTWHKSMHSKRKLAWILSQGNASVSATFGKKSYELQVTTLQAIALNAFNNDKTLSFTELSALLNLQEITLKPLLHSLSCGKYKVINKSPASNKINTTDTFSANCKFSSNMRKIRIPMASLDASHNKKRLEEDRSIAIEASIVRVMKARKTLKHQELIAEVLSQLAFFRPQGRIIKQRIESLIEREYLERSENNAEVYNYLA